MDDGVDRQPRRTTWLLRVGYAIACLAVYTLVEHPRDLVGSAILLLTAGFLIAFRALRPLAELVRLGARHQAMAGATPVTLVGAEGQQVLARTAEGQELVFEPAPLYHDDALLHTRRGPAYLLFSPPREDAQGAYRSGRPFVEAHDIELAGDRTARMDLLRALLAELLVRGLVPLPFFVAGFLLLGLDG